MRGDFFEPSYVYFKDFPIRPINFSDSSEKALHEKMIDLVEQILANHKSLALAQTPQDKSRIDRQIEVNDRAIDLLVYELFELSEEEIKIVEFGNNYA